nr:8614_t:CDS:2 [Entrophospora candida]
MALNILLITRNLILKESGDVVVDSIRFVYDRHNAIGGRLGEHRRNYSYKILEVQNTTKNIPGKNIPFDNNKELALPAGVIFGGSSDYFDSLGEYELMILLGILTTAALNIVVVTLYYKYRNGYIDC